MSKAIKTLNCPACGAPTSPDATRCDHCRAGLATVACPACFGLVFKEARHCSHCGAPVARTELTPDKPLGCPRCRVAMGGAMVGKVTLSECSRCHGLWTDTATLQQICADQEKQSSILGAAALVSATQERQLEKVVYVPCPVCAKIMNRVNFAKCSGVIVDVCRTHGTWFDQEELRRLVEFIHGGGLLRAREKEVAELERRKRSAEGTRGARLMDHRTYGDGISWRGTGGDAVEFGLTAAAEALMNFLD